MTARSRSSKKKHKGKSKSRSKSINGRNPVKCYHCQEEEHFKINCPKRKKDFKEKNVSDGGASVCEFGYDSSDALTVCENSVKEMWIMDFGCSFHMTPNRHWFANYQATNGGKVLLGNDHECKVQGIGEVRLKMHDNTYRTLQAVRHIPELKRNLISLGELTRNGYSFKGEGDTLKVSKGSLVCMKAS